jgi:syntaxin-binding protein 5
MQFHPRDIGTLLIGYTEGAALFSFKLNKPTKFFQYEVPRGAPGGDPDLAGPHEARRPRLSHAIWHPTGTFILTVHDDSSLVFWDPRDGRIVEARTIQTTSIHLPGGGVSAIGGSAGVKSMKQPYLDIAWCSKENPDDTGLLVAGGTPTSNPTPGLTFFDLGPTPNYQTSSWDILSKHFQNPRRTQILPTPPNAEVVKLLLIPRSSPHYAGSQDPIAVITLLSSGELITLSFPSGHPITTTNQLHVSLSFVHPFVTKIALACIDRTRWLGTRESRQQGPNMLLGGAEENKPLKRHENRNVVQTAHADGKIRVWDAGHGDEIENSDVLQVDLARAVGRYDNIDVAEMSMSGATGELSVGLRSGEVAIFRLNKNQQAGREPPPPKPNAPPGRLTNIMERADPALKEGLLPLSLLNEQQGQVTALKHSDVGFVAVGFEGSIAVIDMRGPAIIHTQLLSDLLVKSKRGSIRRSNSQIPAKGEVPTVIEFGVMTLDGDGELCLILQPSTTNDGQITRQYLCS